MKPIKKYRVTLEQTSNGLTAHVDVVSVNKPRAGEFAREQFFPGGGWKVLKVEILHAY